MADVLYLHRGGSAAWQIPITNSDGTARVLTGITSLVFLAKRRIDDADADAVLTVTPTVTDAAAGLIKVAVTPALSVALDAGTYVWGLQFKETDGSLWEFPPPSSDPGKLLVKSDVVLVVPA